MIPDTPILKLAAECERLRDENTRLLAALKQIAKGEGRFSRDPYEHACNVIEDMKRIASAALTGAPDEVA